MLIACNNIDNIIGAVHARDSTVNDGIRNYFQHARARARGSRREAKRKLKKARKKKQERKTEKIRTRRDNKKETKRKRKQKRTESRRNCVYRYRCRPRRRALRYIIFGILIFPYAIRRDQRNLAYAKQVAHKAAAPSVQAGRAQRGHNA